jgi:hypothetical protein
VLESLTVHTECDTFLSEILHNSTEINQMNHCFSVDLWFSLLSLVNLLDSSNGFIV